MYRVQTGSIQKGHIVLKKSEMHFRAFIRRGDDGSLPWVITRVAGNRFEARTIDGCTATVFQLSDPSLVAVKDAEIQKCFVRLL